jgi:hypothetical protein
VATGAAWLKGRNSQGGREEQKHPYKKKKRKNRKTHLTHTGLLMEGVGTPCWNYSSIDSTVRALKELGNMRTAIWLSSLLILLSLGMGHSCACQTMSNEERTVFCQGSHGDKLAAEFTVAGDFLEHDPDAQRFQAAFATELEASEVLYWWGCDESIFPENGVRVHLVSTQVKDADGEILGSAIVATATRRSPKDPFAEIPIDTKHWFLPHDSPVENTVHEYFAQLRSKLPETSSAKSR